MTKAKITEQGLLEDRFELLEEIGKGASGTVYKAKDHLNGDVVAFKLFFEDASIPHFRREMKILAKIKSPHIPEYMSHGALVDGRHFSVTEYLEGEDLRTYFDQHNVSTDEAYAIIKDIALALSTLHKEGFVHRDIKPPNIFIKPQGNELKAYLIDFGVACSVETCRGDGGLIGTPPYICPEMARGDHEQTTAASDIYSLSAVFYELLTGRCPHDGHRLHSLLHDILNETITPPEAYNPKLSPQLSELVLRGLSKRPEERPRDGRAFLKSLEKVQQQTPLPVVSAKHALILPPSPEPRTLALLMLKERHGNHTLLQSHIYNDIKEMVESRNGQLFQLPQGSLIGVFGLNKTLGDEVRRGLKTGLKVLTRHYLSASLILARYGGDIDIAPAIKTAEKLLNQPGNEEGIRVDGNAMRSARGEFMIVREKGFSVIAGTTDWLSRLKNKLSGRENDLSLIKKLQKYTVSHQTTNLTIIMGEDGIGKSSLAASAFRMAAEKGYHLYAATADSQTADVPYATAQRLLYHRAGISEDHEEEARNAHIQRLVKQHPAYEKALKALLTDLQPEDILDVDARRLWLWETFAAIVQRDLDHQPTFIILDDFHQADTMTQRLLIWLLNTIKGPLGLIICIVPNAWPNLKEAIGEGLTTTVLNIRPLSNASAREVIEASIPGIDIEETNAIIERADGNPLFLEELCQLQKRGIGERSSTRNLQMATQASLDRLSPRAIALARYAAVIGDHGPFSPLSRLLNVDCLKEECAELEAAQIWRANTEKKNTFRFRHNLIRDTLYQNLPEDRRRSSHTNLALYFERRKEPDYLRAAHHYLKAHRSEEAGNCLLEVALRTHRAADFETTRKMLGRLSKITLSPSRRHQFLYLRAGTYTWLGRLALAHDDIKELLDDPTLESDVLTRAACLGCLQMRRLSNIQEALRLSDVAITEAQKTKDPFLIANSYFNAAFAYYDAGDATGIKACLKAIKELDAHVPQIQSLHAELETLLAFSDRQFERAISYSKWALELNRSFGNLVRLGANVANTGLAYMQLGRFGEALPLLQSARKIYKRQGNRLQRYDAALNEARVHFFLNHHDKALKQLEDARRGLNKAGESHFNLVVKAIKARVLVNRNEEGDRDEALSIAREIILSEDASLVHKMEALIAGMEVFDICEIEHDSVEVAEQIIGLLDWTANHNEHVAEAACYAALLFMKYDHPLSTKMEERAKAELQRILSACEEEESKVALLTNVRAFRKFAKVSSLG